MPVELYREGNVFILAMKNGENRVSKELVDQINAHLDTIESTEGAVALVTTGSGDFFSNGLDVQAAAQLSKEEQAAISKAIFKTLARILTFPIPTVCAINGHAFGAGFYMALCHDYRVMRNDLGWLCINAINIGVNLPPSLFELSKAKIPQSVLREVLLRGKRWSGKEAEKAGIVDASVPASELLEVAVKTASQLIADDLKNARAIEPRKELVRSFKQKIYSNAYRLLSEGEQPIDVSKSTPPHSAKL